MNEYYLEKYGEVNEYWLVKNGEPLDVDYTYEEMMMYELYEQPRMLYFPSYSRGPVIYPDNEDGLTYQEIDDLISDWWGNDL